MLEIPELLTLKNSLEKRFTGKGVIDFQILCEKNLVLPKNSFIASIVGRELVSVRRTGNMLHLHFEHGQTLGLVLGRDAQPYLCSKEKDEKAVSFKLLFENGTGIAIRDLRRQTSISLNPPDACSTDILSPAFTFEDLHEVIRKNRSMLVRLLFMDVKKRCWLGDVYVDEILWKIGVSPFSIVKYVPTEKFKQLLEASRQILHLAFEQACLSLGPDQLTAQARECLNIYNPGKRFDPEGYPIQVGYIGKIKTCWTDKQYLYQVVSHYWPRPKS